MYVSFADNCCWVIVIRTCKKSSFQNMLDHEIEENV